MRLEMKSVAFLCCVSYSRPSGTDALVEVVSVRFEDIMMSYSDLQRHQMVLHPTMSTSIGVIMVLYLS